MTSEKAPAAYTQEDTERWYNESLLEARAMRPELLQQSIIELISGRGQAGFVSKQLELKFRAYNVVAVALMKVGYDSQDDGK